MDTEGKALLSVKVANEEAEIMALLANTGSLAAQLIWAVDIIGAPSALPSVTIIDRNSSGLIGSLRIHIDISGLFAPKMADATEV